MGSCTPQTPCALADRQHSLRRILSVNKSDYATPKGGLPVAIYHCSIKIIKRSQGKSAVAAAYRSGEKLTNEYDGVTHDYTRKGGIVHAEILLPENAPPTLQNRSELWNSVELFEKNSDAQLAREIEIVLPAELDRQAQLALVRAYINDTFVSVGMCADFALHDKGDDNPHAHIMLTLRPLEHGGTWGAKCRKEYDLDEQGQRIRLPSGAFKSHRVNTTDWNDREKAEQWRSAWSDYANRSLEQHGVVERIDHRSYKRQGVDKIPTVHMGVAATQMERRGIATDKGNINREVAAQNKLLKEIKARITRLYNWSKENTKQPEKASILELLKQPTPSKPTTQYGKIQALKGSAALFHFLQSNGISSMAELHAKITAMQDGYYALRGEIKNTEREIATLTKHLEIWGQYGANKHPKTDSEKALLESAAKYLNELKASGGGITPKKWTADVSRLTAHKNELYQKMQSMREDIKTVENIRKNAEQLAATTPPPRKEQNHDR
ncbi:MAG: MobQ family relaxase [Lachnospiraceae bacterium]|nr:MobQ family relaxase [Lachnospiraceae bacterium]